tara:strand:+ start:10 stop:366 length:357 start_codon:yes stop_codon:yes gene_type:complete
MKKAQYINAEGEMQDIVTNLDRLDAKRNIYRAITAKFESACEYGDVEDIEPMLKEVMCDGVKTGENVIFHVEHEDMFSGERNIKTVYHVNCYNTWRNMIAATTIAFEEERTGEQRLKS